MYYSSYVTYVGKILDFKGDEIPAFDVEVRLQTDKMKFAVREFAIKSNVTRFGSERHMLEQKKNNYLQRCSE